MPISEAFGYTGDASPSDIYAKALNYNDMLNRYGLDRTYMFRGLCDFVISLYEEGVITREDTGMELNRDFDTLFRLAKAATFREGFGDVLADGPVVAAEKIGNNAKEYLQNVVKGQFVTFDPRASGLGSMQFAQLTFPGRCFPVSGALGAPTYSAGWGMPAFIKQAKRCGVPEEAMGRIFTQDSFNPARLAKHAEDFYGLFNMLGLCHRLYISRFYSLDIMAQLYSAVTGIETTAGDLKNASERVWDDWKLLNYRAGFDRKDDEPPKIWFQPIKGENKEYHLTDYFRTRTLDAEDVEKLLDDYYDERGWDPEKGMPSTK
jgi:aldehyde:ferredoxin oxidoreductase